jgi:hypothetical protein
MILIVFLISCDLTTVPDQKITTNRSWTKLKTNGKLKIQEKIWLHRTNHPDKFNKYADSYTGFELDININESGRYFEVYHEPEKPTGIDFADYLKQRRAKQKSFWLDCKNLDMDNAALAIKILDQLDKTYHIKNRILVESRHMDAVKLIRIAGYNTVLYLTYPELNGSLRDSLYLAKLVNHWDDQLLGISAEAKYIPLLNAYLPFAKKLTWCNNPVKNILLGEKQKMLADTSVLIVLEKR